MKKTLVLFIILLTLIACQSKEEKEAVEAMNELSRSLGGESNFESVDDIKKTWKEGEDRQRKIEECKRMPDGVKCRECVINCERKGDELECPNQWKDCEICTTERYNAEVEKNNECIEKFK